MTSEMTKTQIRRIWESLPDTMQAAVPYVQFFEAMSAEVTVIPESEPQGNVILSDSRNTVWRPHKGAWRGDDRVIGFSSLTELRPGHIDVYEFKERIYP